MPGRIRSRSPRASAGKVTPTPSRGARAMQNFRRFHGTPSSSPLIMFLLGALVLLLFAAATVVQIQTSEMLAQGGSGQVSTIAWSVWTQPYLIVTGQVPPGESTS